MSPYWLIPIACGYVALWRWGNRQFNAGWDERITWENANWTFGPKEKPGG